MSSLVVRDISDEVVQALEDHARRLGVSAEVAHRQILEQALTSPNKKSFIEILKAMPDVGEDSDFRRV
ncbi:FitA-like ribbon-helix-helix domain-containing protein [Leucothrix mucor]|uniref:FitA-like ribbon-helix-helix domain-containing protein n=1 Tax=Leucothrix mucor TaxID=45248 RepID=UPI0003B4A819|nr:hypothetical protein [Leucothrix mucor]